MFPRLKGFGKWFITPFYAIGSAIITTVAISLLPWISALSLPLLIFILTSVFLAESTVTIYQLKDAVPDTLIGLFGAKDIFNHLTRNQKILLGLGIFSALGSGLALAALTYTSGITAIAAVLGLFSIAFPPVGIGLAGGLALVAFIALSVLL